MQSFAPIIIALAFAIAGCNRHPPDAKTPAAASAWSVNESVDKYTDKVSVLLTSLDTNYTAVLTLMCGPSPSSIDALIHTDGQYNSGDTWYVSWRIDNLPANNMQEWEALGSKIATVPEPQSFFDQLQMGNRLLIKLVPEHTDGAVPDYEFHLAGLPAAMAEFRLKCRANGLLPPPTPLPETPAGQI